MYDSRYSKFLTILLIVVIVIILGLLIFWGVDSINKYNIKNDAQDGIDAFKNQIPSGNVTNTVPDLNLPGNNNVVDIQGNNIGNNVVIVDPYQNLITPDDNPTGNDGNNGNGNSNDGSSSGDTSFDGTMYKGYKMVGYIEIPKTDVELPILEEAYAIDVSIVILDTNSSLNKPGVTVLAGHNYKNGTFFSDNAKLSIGDKVYITDSTGKKVTYEIYKKYEASSSHYDYINVDANGKCELVLTTCASDNDYRTIICAREV